MSAIDALLSSRPCFDRRRSVSLIPRRRSVSVLPFCNQRFRTQTAFTRKSSAVRCESASGPEEGDNLVSDDFVGRVLKENPSQVEPRYLVGDKFYTFKEKQNGRNKDQGVIQLLKRKLNSKKDGAPSDSSASKEKSVQLDDLLRTYRGKLYVPEQVFGKGLHEEEEFDKNLETLPKMSLDDLRKAMEYDKVKLLTSKEPVSGVGYRDFIVDLKEIPGAKSLHKTQWSLRLNDNEVQDLLEEYTGPLNEIEKQNMSWVGKAPEYPHPVASYISSRILVGLAMVTAIMAGAAVVVGGFFAGAVFAAGKIVYNTIVYAVWPVVLPLLKLFFGIIYDIVETIWNRFADGFYEGGIFFRVKSFYTMAGFASGLEVLKPVGALVLLMVLIIRFTMSSKPRNFRRWDLWTGIKFSRSKAEARVDGITGVTFNDIAGIEDAVDELQELVRYLKNPELFDKMCIKPPHGVLLEGPPGCGKTLVAKAIAGEAGVPFYQMAGSEFVEVLVGVGSARIRDLFKRAKVNRPSVIFIDEVDALATKRQLTFKETKDQLYNAGTQERETTLNQLLIELDGFDTGKGVIFLAATNRRDLLDPALLRPGRFDRKIKIRPPNAKGRFNILKIHSSKVKMSETVDLSSYALNLPGWTGARLAQLVQEAALVAVRKGHKAILTSDMDAAFDRLTVGPKRLGSELGHQGQCRRATTEVGVALTSHLLRKFENADIEQCDRISIVPRGLTLAQLVFHRLEDEKYFFERRPQLLHRLQVFLGGRAAEEVIYGRETSKVSAKYLADASWLARKILTIWNMEETLAIRGQRPAWKKKPKFVGPRLDFEGSLYVDQGLSEPPINLKLDDDVAKRTEDLVNSMYKKTLALLRRHHAALLKSVKVLVTQREISGEELDFILSNYPAQTPVSVLLQEENPGSLPFFPREESDYALANQSKEESFSGR